MGEVSKLLRDATPPPEIADAFFSVVEWYAGRAQSERSSVDYDRLSIALACRNATQMWEALAPDVVNPALNITLTLYIARLERRPIDVAEICRCSDVPFLTALRWIDVMILQGRVIRHKVDETTELVELTEDWATALDRHHDRLCALNAGS